MIRSMYTAATGMEAQQLFMDTISNNLSNVNTNGYKRSKVEFQDLMYQTLKVAGLQTPEGDVAPVGIEVGLGVKPGATQRLFDQGSLQETTNPLDIALEGQGFFQIPLPDGTMAYTRDGTFKISADGTIVTSAGYPLEPQITIPAEVISVNISQDGKVTAVLPNKDAAVELGQIEVANFMNPAGLSSLGGNLLVATEASGEPIVGVPGDSGLATLRQGYTEASNVKVVDEMVNMIAAQRAYEIVSKSIQVSDEMLQTANNLKR